MANSVMANTERDIHTKPKRAARAPEAVWISVAACRLAAHRKPAENIEQPGSGRLSAGTVGISHGRFRARSVVTLIESSHG